MLTGDASINPDAPVICCTAEVLANVALRYGEDAPVDQVVMDEFHFYADPDRGWAWQVPLIELRRAQFVLMSATLGDTSRFARDLQRRTGKPTTVVSSLERPVPLDYRYARTLVHDTINELVARGPCANLRSTFHPKGGCRASASTYERAGGHTRRP